MERRSLFRRKLLFAGICVTLLLVLAAGLWFERVPLLAWYEVRGLMHAGPEARAAWIDPLTGMEDAALPRLLRGLESNDARACSNIQAGLTAIVQRWEHSDLRRSSLAEQLSLLFQSFSGPGQESALDLETMLLQQRSAPDLDLAAAALPMLTQTAHAGDGEVRKRGLTLAEALLDLAQGGQISSASRDLACACFDDADPAIRLNAIKLSVRYELNLLEQLVPLLKDPVPEVRRSVMRILGPSPSIVATDDLLPWLHDPDPEVRRLCESALYGRGLRGEHLRLGRLMTDEQAGTRLRVLDLLAAASDLDPGVWIRRLSHDASPAVRAAAVRAAAQQGDGLADRLEQMSRNDPSPTVRQIARFYLSSRTRQLPDSR